MKGEVVYLYAFDVANEIVTSRIQEILSQKPFPYEIRFDKTFPRDVPIYRPLAVGAAALAARPISGQPIRQLMRVYDIGVVTVAMILSFEVQRLSDSDAAARAEGRQRPNARPGGPRSSAPTSARACGSS